MTGADLVLAAILLTTAPGTPETVPPPDRFPAMRDAVHQLGIEWEILDPRETRYVLTRPEEYSGDLDMLRRRYRELADAPRVADSMRFPDRSQVNELVRFNRAFRKYLDQRQQFETDRAPTLREVIAETDRLYQVWDSVRDARCEFYYVTVRRHALKKLRDQIGENDYLAGTLPPNVPMWRFNEMK
ncbi:hypothetical protein [Fimbriiglobus ruber]|uniref:Uncharacterized protein n=1 Tax=Fimbriiglobus ruber TaxID=1908690 RepID=A0A225D5R1_9BACT|nr:hypothetical protein [Fimbriiglobus ruber]OWK36313.1 hypothetical protein FRUB_08876 [Fimbriiglobus ruber]